MANNKQVTEGVRKGLSSLLGGQESGSQLQTKRIKIESEKSSTFIYTGFHRKMKTYASNNGLKLYECMNEAVKMFLESKGIDPDKD